MRGVVFTGERRLEIREFPDPTPGPGEVVLEIKASGMCGSDLKGYRAVGGAASLGFTNASGPIIAGHEPCGVVVAIGAGVAANQAPMATTTPHGSWPAIIGPLALVKPSEAAPPTAR